MSDLINRADAIRVISEEYHNRGGNFDGLDAIRELETLPLKGGDAEILNEDFRPKYMQQCPNNGADLISRADAIEAVVSWTVEDRPHEVMPTDLVDRIKALPSADAVHGEWMPCSERLPIPPMFCLVTTDGSHGDVIDIALYMSDGWHKASEVIAWMPLPTPYKGGDDE